MKKIFAIIAATVLCLASVSCNKEAFPAGSDKLSVRVSVTPDPGTIPAVGADFESVVAVNQGVERNVAWTVSVDGNPDWISLQTKTVKSSFVGTYAGDDKDLELDGIACNVSVNLTGKKRVAILRFTTANGASAVYTLTQSAK